jgi:ribosome maturation factor RimP
MEQINLNRPGVLPQVEAEIEGFVEEFGYELVLLRVGREGRHRTLTLYLDKPDGVTADDCQEMSQRISVLLDVLDPFPGSYRLIVSSPGLDRPLTKDQHFRRFEGQEAVVVSAPPGGKIVRHRGILAGVAEDTIRLQTAEGLVEIPKAHLIEARLVVRWDD